MKQLKFALIVFMIYAALMTGCSAFRFESPSSRNGQIAISTLLALDTAQTITIARSPDCLYEGNGIAAAIFGSETPSPQRVIGTNLLYITGHWMLGSYLDRNAERTVDLSLTAEQDLARKQRFRIMRGIYKTLTVLGHGAAVLNNANQGIAPASRYRCDR